MLRPGDRPLEVARTTATIASGESLSGAVDLGGLHLVGLIMPATWTAASITLQASLDGETWHNVYDVEGIEVEITADASRWIAIDPVGFAGFSQIRLRSGTAAAAVNQGAARSIDVISRSI